MEEILQATSASHVGPFLPDCELMPYATHFYCDSSGMRHSNIADANSTRAACYLLTRSNRTSCPCFWYSTLADTVDLSLAGGGSIQIRGLS